MSEDSACISILARYEIFIIRMATYAIHGVRRREETWENVRWVNHAQRRASMRGD